MTTSQLASVPGMVRRLAAIQAELDRLHTLRHRAERDMAAINDQIAKPTVPRRRRYGGQPCTAT